MKGLEPSTFCMASGGRAFERDGGAGDAVDVADPACVTGFDRHALSFVSEFTPSHVGRIKTVRGAVDLAECGYRFSRRVCCLTFIVEGYRDGHPVTVEWTDGLAIGSSRLIEAMLAAADARVPIEVHPDGRVIVAALEPAEIAFATILALLDGIPTAARGDVPELFRGGHHWAEVA
jgi:hypothetical protein